MSEAGGGRADPLTQALEKGAQPGWFNLGLIPSGSLRDQAIAALRARDPIGFLISTSNELALQLVFYNANLLKALGMYEATLVHAVIATRTNNHRDHSVLRWLLDSADRERLRDAGDPLPGPGPFTVYRGVGGRTRARRIRGYSWTGSLERARWFAHRAGLFGFADPAVYRVVVPTEHVLFRSDEREEDEYVLELPKNWPIQRVDVPPLDPHQSSADV